MSLRRSALSLLIGLFSLEALAGQPSLKLPFEAGVTIRVSHGYWSLSGNDPSDSHAAPSDRFALDFVGSGGSGCEIFGTSVVAAQTGVVSKVVRGKSAVFPVSRRGIADGYGNYIILDHGDGYFTRYAHLSEVDDRVQVGAPVIQGYSIGKVGDTGYAVGSVCSNSHAGVHLHFALYKDGNGKSPEPMSGYVGFLSGNSYTSDNGQSAWAKAKTSTLVDENRWIYWKMNASDPTCTAGSNHVIDDMDRGICIQVSSESCPESAFFVTVDDVFGGSFEDQSASPPITGGKHSGDLPNLIVHELYLVKDADSNSPHLSQIHIGERSYCNIQVKNTGEAGAWDEWANRCYLSKGNYRDHDPDNLGHESMDDLAAGQSRRVYQIIPPFEYPGTFNITACADTDGSSGDKAVTESDEGDNCYDEVRFTVVSDPDVAVTGLSLNTTVLEATVANIGENFGPDVVRISYAVDGAFVGFDQVKRENLKGGMSKVESVDISQVVAETGTHTARACIDYDSQIVEVNEVNNCKDLTFVVQGASVPATGPDPDAVPTKTPSTKQASPAALQLLFD
ncbi:MAG: peptidoglycan DD-metalloendopeptidase family protein [Candidatus Moraniibacteriota bacterium]|nr:MAG: peptidoglycan DD-metalloendopeptidase family protein [Candidatus Moranbacteria bacterium]